MVALVHAHVDVGGMNETEIGWEIFLYSVKRCTRKFKTGSAAEATNADAGRNACVCHAAPAATAVGGTAAGPRNRLGQTESDLDGLILDSCKDKICQNRF